MTCFHPLTAYRSKDVNSATGKRSLVFSSSHGLVERSPQKLPCGQCIGCRSDRAQEWAIRCGHEAMLHDASCFLTLTYDDQNVPADYSVDLRQVQLFVKRLRKRAGVVIRFFACGEYGDEFGRPHYHLLIFGFDFPDKTKWAERNGYRTFKSEMLEELWPYGLSEIGSVSHQSAGYVARYVQKKITGARADDHYSRVSPVDGAVYRVKPEFATMSLRPGIGATWFDRFKSDAFPSDFLVMDDGRKVRPPQFYLRKLAELAELPRAKPGQVLSAPKTADVAIKRARKVAAAKPSARADCTPGRLRVREVVKAAQLSRLRRVVE